MKKTLLSIVFLALAAFSVHTVFSAEIQTGNNINLSGQTVSSNFYTAGGSVLLNNNFEKDVFVAGGKINVSGTVLGDLFVIGGEIDVTGKITGDVRVMGGQTIVKGQIDGDLVVIGGTITLARESKINGESIFVGAELNQETPIVNKLKILAGNVNLNNIVSGETGVTTQKITFGDHAQISGNFRYYAPDKAETVTGATVASTVAFNEIKNISEIGIVKTTVLNLLSFWIILKFVTTLIVAFLLVYIFIVFTQGVNNVALDSFLKNIFVGALVLIVVPIIVAVLFVSLIAMPIGFLLLLMYLFTLIITPAFAGIIIGSLTSKMFAKEGAEEQFVTFKTAALGVILFTAIQFVPYLGDITRIVFTLVAFGAIYRYSHDAIIK